MGAETKIQVREIKKGMEAAGSAQERYLIRFLGPLGRKISEATQTGRIMALSVRLTIEGYLLPGSQSIRS